MKALTTRWQEQGGYRHLLKVAIPLVLSTGSTSILHFIDRMFLTWYSPNSIAAAMPASVVNFTIMSLFIGTTSYVSTFVAQYSGAKRLHKIGPSLWQGLYIAVFGGAILFALSFASGPLFRFVGHDPAIQVEEVAYFSILSKGAIFQIAAVAFAGFFSGRGQTWPIMWINVVMTAVNLGLDYPFIFGKLGLPEMGIHGAAYATVISGAVACALYCMLIFKGQYNDRYRTRSGWRLDRDLFRRMLKYGLPSGTQFFIDISGFSIFFLLIGRIGAAELAATSITFNINSLAFLPMMGMGVAVSVTVGQFQGQNRPDLAQRSVFNSTHIAFLYMALIASTYIFLPEMYIGLFASRADPSQFEPLRRFIMVMLRFVAVYTLLDTLTVVFASALKGAGDTKFVMLMILFLSVGVLTVPILLAMLVFKAGIYIAWYILSIYIAGLGLSFLFRFLTGKWRSMRVIESTETALDAKP